MKIADARPGAVVRLNSGTLRMTVAGVDVDAGRVLVEWHDRDDSGNEGDYEPAMLTLVKPAPDDEG